MKRLRNSRRKKTETSKVLLIFSDILIVTVTVITTVAVFVLGDVTPLEYIIPAAFGLSATSHGFYYWKAKNENIAKYGNNTDDEGGIS